MIRVVSFLRVSCLVTVRMNRRLLLWVWTCLMSSLLGFGRRELCCRCLSRGWVSVSLGLLLVIGLVSSVWIFVVRPEDSGTCLFT